MSVTETEQAAPKGRGRKPKTNAEALPKAAQIVTELEQREKLAKAKRLLEDMWPFLNVELDLVEGQLCANAKFGSLHVEALGHDIKMVVRDLKQWARYQLWQKERKDEMTAWAKSDPAREEWIELHVPLTSYKDSSGPHAR